MRHTVLVTSLKALVLALLISVIFSLMARFYWFFDLFSHFLLQYTFAGMVLAACLAVVKTYRFSLLALCIAFVSLAESRVNLDKPFAFLPMKLSAENNPRLIRLVQFNHNVGKRRFSDVKHWLEINAGAIDVAVLQEATHRTIAMAESLREHYPHQIHQPRHHALGMVILSRHPFLSTETIPINGPVVDNILIKMVFGQTLLKQSFTLYALHALPPMNRVLFEQRNAELNLTAKLVAQDKSKHLALIGDWNITPYSPYFSELVQASGLRFQSYGVFLNPSWPSWTQFNVLRIPIDHLLFSDTLTLLDKKIDDSFGSDHMAIVNTLTVRKH